MLRSSPVLVLGISGARTVGCGASHTCIVLLNGESWCTGDNSRGHLGNNETDTEYNTVQQTLTISSGNYVEVGGFGSCVILDNDELYCWGGNDYGQLGIGSSGVDQLLPRFVQASVRQVSNNLRHVCFVTTGGVPYCQGENTDGKLGDGTVIQRDSPTAVSGLTGDVYMIVAARAHSCALLIDGLVKCWGNNDNGALGVGTMTPSLIPIETSIINDGIYLSSGRRFVTVINYDNRVYFWGENTNNQGGLDVGGGNVLTPVIYGGNISDATIIADGLFHSCFESESGSVICSGQNSFGQCGVSNLDSTVTNVLVLGLPVSTNSPTL